MDIDDTAGSDMGMAQSPLRSPFSKDRADGDEERAERGLALADGDAFWKGEPTGLLSSLNGSNKDETGGEEEREPRLQGIVEGGAKEGPPLLHYVTCVRLSSAEDAEVKVDDVMGVGEDPVGEDGMDIDAPAWPPAGVEPAMRA
eukprot:jgi/Tetstr1/424957/TSEL_015450.t1